MDKERHSRDGKIPSAQGPGRSRPGTGEAVPSAEERFRAMAEAAPDWEYMLGPDHHIIFSSSSCERITGYTPEEFAKDPGLMISIIHPEDRPCFEEHLLEEEAGTRDGEIEFRIIRRDGRERWIGHRCRPVTSRPGGFVGRWATNRDITGSRRIGIMLAQSNLILDRLMTSTRHDIINQLMVLSGALELIRQLGPSSEGAHYLAMSEDALSTIDREIQFTREYRDLGIPGPRWQNVHDTFRDASKYREIGRIRIEAADDALEVFADPLLEKVFSHLISHTLAKGENATFIRLSHVQSGEELVIRVEDDGPGIALAEKPYLFDRGFGPGRRPELCFAREILSITGISISEAGISGRDTRFEIIVPEWAYRYATHPAPPADLASGYPGKLPGNTPV
jgi:PAS domain S-box-containing protein